jgi:O-antigen/teichoic acid export membrane protein
MFLSKTVSLSDLGIYGLAYKLGMVVPFVTAPFFTYWNSQMVGIVKQPQGEYTYARMATYLLLILVVVSLLLTVFADPLLMFLVAPEFRGAAVLIPWIALAYLIRGMGSFWSNTFLLDKRSGLVARTTWMGGVVCLLAYALLIPVYGLWGAVAATLMGFSAMAGYALWKSQRVRPFRYEYGRWAKIVGCGMAAALPSVLLHPGEFWVQIALGFACIGLFAVLLVAARFATEGERHAAHAELKRLFLRSQSWQKALSRFLLLR